MVPNTKSCSHCFILDYIHSRLREKYLSAPAPNRPIGRGTSLTDKTQSLSFSHGMTSLSCAFSYTS
jgi:hypothetical protein